MKKVIALLLSGSLVCGVMFASPQQAEAVPQFMKQFQVIYIAEDNSDPAVLEFAKAVETAKCNICHKGKSKKDRNPYGEELSKLLDKKDDAKNDPKIQEALKSVEDKKADGAELTYGELIKQGALPFVNPEE